MPETATAAVAATAARSLRIGDLARATGFGARTIRYYETLGLVKPQGRTRSGYRMFAPEAVERLGFVRRARGLGLRLEDIARILEISDEGRVPCQHVMAVVDRELGRVAEQMKRLRGLRRGLVALRSRMANALASGATLAGEGCPCFEEDGIERGDVNGRDMRLPC